MKLMVILFIAWCFLHCVSGTGVHDKRLEDDSSCRDVREVSFRTMKGGIAKATSRWSDDYIASRGFANGYTWHAAHPSKLPQSIWYEFPGALKVITFAFQSRTDGRVHKGYTAPKYGTSKYEFWGSNAADCSDTESRVILVEDNSGTPFSKNNDPKVEYVDTPQSYRCYGFTINGNPENKFYYMSNIRFWYERENQINTTKHPETVNINMLIKDGPEAFENANLDNNRAPGPEVCVDLADNCQEYLKVCSHFKVRAICPKTCGACIAEPGVCPDDYWKVPLGSQYHCYKFFTDKQRNYPDARSKCLAEGADLPHPKDPLSLRKYIVEKFGGNYGSWLGAEGNGTAIRWVDDGKILSNTSPYYYPGHPNSPHWTQFIDCLSLLSSPYSLSKQPSKPYAIRKCHLTYYTLCGKVV